MIKRKVLEKIIDFGKSNKIFRYPAIVFCFFWLLFYYLAFWMYSKKYKMIYAASIIAVVLFTGSFAYPNESADTAPIQEVTDEIPATVSDEYVHLFEEENAASGTVSDTDGNGLTSENNKVIEFYQHPDWNLILINKEHPIDATYSFELKKITGKYSADTRICDAVQEMLEAGKKDGVSLILCSAYRDYNRQVELFNTNVESLMKQGYSYVDSYNKVAESLTIPGSSEHQAGLAVDIVTPRYQMLNDGFGETPAGKWLAENCYKYGFILRYPKGKEDITGITYEPWHFRYVGVEAATQISKENIALEEYLEQYRLSNYVNTYN